MSVALLIHANLEMMGKIINLLLHHIWHEWCCVCGREKIQSRAYYSMEPVCSENISEEILHVKQTIFALLYLNL